MGSIRVCEKICIPRRSDHQRSQRAFAISVDAITAIMLYHASLAFLANRLLAKPQVNNRGTSSTTPNSAEEVFLDQPEDVAICRFLQHGHGSPCLRSTSSGTVHLAYSKSIMRVVIEILRANYDNRPKPHLAEKLIQLMTGLEGSFIS